MKIIKKILLLFLCAFYLQHSQAQNINGFQVYVMKEQLTAITFHSEVKSSIFSLTPSPYSVIFYGADFKTIYIRTDKQVKKACNLMIEEGGRMHKFIVLFKDYVEPSQTDLNYEDLNKLKTLVANFNPSAVNTTSQSEASTTNDLTANNTTVAADEKNTVATNVTSSSNTNFYVLIDEGDKARKNNDLQTAKNKYLQALQLQPDNGYAQTQLQNVNQSFEIKYNDAITKAKQATIANNFDEAITYFNSALEIKPGDSYAISQLVIVKSKADAFKVQQANVEKDNLFNSYLKAGDKEFAEKSYNAANEAYNEALKIKPGNTLVLSKINVLHQKVINDSIAEEREKVDNLFSSFLNAGNAAIGEESYASAKLAFIEALKIKPNNAEAKSKLSSTNQLLYLEFYNSGNDALNKKSYEEARDAYTEALKVKPNDVAATAKLNSISSIRAHDEAENNFNNYILLGDKAVNQRSYQEASVAYTEALKLKPNDVTAKTKLNSIPQKIIKDSLDADYKKNEDSYTNFMTAGDNALISKLYNEARLNYNQALKIKSNDLAAKEKIEVVDNNLYIDFVKEGDSAFVNKQYNRAIDAYNNALKIKPENIDAANKLILINNAKTQDKLDELYKSYIDAGDRAFNNKSYNEANTSYNSAVKLKPNDSIALAKIDLVTQRKVSDSLSSEVSKNRGLFKSFVDTANIETEQKNYSGAIFYFTQALKLMPDDKSITPQIAKLKQLIAQSQTDSLNKIKTEQINAINNTVAESKEKTVAAEIENSMLLVKARLFKMGSDVGATDEEPMHVVQLDSFYIGKFEVTQSQWQSIMGNNPSFFKDCDDCPVENVSWNDVMKFIEKLNQITNKKFRLPTEAEWEYIAGTQNRREDINNIAWYNDNAQKKTHHIGLLKPVYLGAYDLFGNVAEWCSDWYSSSSYKNNLAVNPIGAINGKQKVVRGGDWYDMEGAFRLTIRDKLAPDKANKKIGFRLVMSIK